MLVLRLSLLAVRFAVVHYIVLLVSTNIEQKYFIII